MSSHDDLQLVVFVCLDAVIQGLWSSEAGGEHPSLNKFGIAMAAKGNVDELYCLSVVILGWLPTLIHLDA